MSRNPFVYYCVVTKQLFVIELRLVFHSTFNFFTSIMGFSSEDNCCQSQELEKSIKDMLVKSILSIRFWQVYLEKLWTNQQTNNVFARIPFVLLIFSQNHARNLGVGLICECSLYMSFYGNQMN